MEQRYIDKDEDILETTRNVRQSYAMSEMMKNHPPTDWKDTAQEGVRVKVCWSVSKDGDSFKVKTLKETEKNGQVKAKEKTYTMRPNRYAPWEAIQ